MEATTTASCPSRELGEPPISLLIRITIPAKPMSNPNTFGIVILSSCNKKCAVKIVNRGTVASRIDATAESMVCSPHEIRKKGIATFVSPTIRSGNQALNVRGHDTRWMEMTTTQKKSPNKARKATSVIGPTSCTAILIHMNEELQMAPNNRNTIQCFVFKPKCPFYL